MAVNFTAIDLPALAASYVYLLCVGSLAPPVADALRAGRVSNAAVFAGWALAFLILPGIYAPRACHAGLLVLGWDAMLSAYSYCVESARFRSPVRSRVELVEDCVFFLLVNPVLVYTQRGSRVSPGAYGMRNIGRIGVGIATLVGMFIVIQPAYRWVSRQDVQAMNASASVVSVVSAAALTGAALAVNALLRLATEYLMQSGVAHLQIGLIRQLGHDIPDRFNRPWLATSPVDFWRRWNTYVGAWVQRYVFWPSSLTMGRRSPFLRGPSGTALAVLVSFGVVGVLHDVVPYLTDLGAHYRGISAFLCAGALVIASYAAEQLVDRISSARLRLVVVPTVARLSLVAFWGSTLALFSWWDK
jgi:hypothetical protein